MKSAAIAIVAIFVLFRDVKGQSADLCRNLAPSCGACIKAHADCGWCSDPSFSGEYRCDSKETLRHYQCRELIDQPPSSVEFGQNNELGAQHSHYPDSVHLLKPQQILMRLSPGETRTFQLKYKHMPPNEDTARIRHSGRTEMTLVFSSDCPHHRQVPDPDENVEPGGYCRGLQDGEIITFTVNVTLKDCATRGDISAGIGISGLNDVMGLYVTPLCGCECEKLENEERGSAHCYARGNLICGACSCNHGFNGRSCENECGESCPRETRPPPQPRTEPPPVHPSEDGCAECPRDHDGKECAGNGQCDCGLCRCDPQWMGHNCDCTRDPHGCYGPSRALCGGRGSCECGRCKCDDSTFRNEFCEEPEDEPGRGHEPTDPHFRPEEPVTDQPDPDPDKPDYDPDDQHPGGHQTPRPEQNPEPMDGDDDVVVNSAGPLNPGATEPEHNPEIKPASEPEPTAEPPAVDTNAAAEPTDDGKQKDPGTSLPQGGKEEATTKKAGSVLRISQIFLSFGIILVSFSTHRLLFT